MFTLNDTPLSDADLIVDDLFIIRKDAHSNSADNLIDLDVLNCDLFEIVGTYRTRLRQIDLWQPTPDGQLIKLFDKGFRDSTILFTVYSSIQHLQEWVKTSNQLSLSGWAKGYANVIRQMSPETATLFRWSAVVFQVAYQEVVDNYTYLQTNRDRLSRSYEETKRMYPPTHPTKASWDLTWEEFLAKEKESGKLSSRHINKETRSLIGLCMEYGTQDKRLAIASHLDQHKQLFLPHLDYYGYSDIADGLMGGGDVRFLHGGYELFHVETWLC